MKNKKLTVTIGIPVYNEEKNIGLLIKEIFKQKQNNFALDKVVIISDACTDKTETIVKSFTYSKLKLIKNKKRVGQSFAQNQIMKSTFSDILVLLESDTLPEGQNYIVLVQGNEKPKKAKSFIGKMIAMQFNIYHDEIIKQSNLRTWFASGRGGRALQKSLYKDFHWLKDVPEDVYLHLFCKNKGHLTEFSTDAVCRYKSPETYRDIKKEMKKVKSGSYAIFNHFPKKLVEKMYTKSLLFRIKCALRFFQTNFFYFITYFFLSLVIINKKTIFSDFLPTTQSTKQLYED